MVPLSSFLGRTVFEKDLGFVKPAHDYQNVSKAKSQNQWSFRICYHSLLETLIKNPFTNRIPTFVNAKVRPLTDLMRPLPVPDIVIPILIRPYFSDDIPVNINISPKIPVIQQETMDVICASLTLKKNLLFLCFIGTNKQTKPTNRLMLFRGCLWIVIFLLRISVCFYHLLLVNIKTAR